MVITGLLCTLWILKCLVLPSRQFGFRDNTKCPTAILTVQKVIHSYKRENSNTHYALIDLTKAIEQTNFDVLISELQNTQVPPLITNPLSFLFNMSFVNVYFNSAFGDEWKIGNGARQGGFLSPTIFIFFFQRCLRVYSRTKSRLQTRCKELEYYFLCRWYSSVSSF